jgi:hypothetical protein
MGETRFIHLNSLWIERGVWWLYSERAASQKIIHSSKNGHMNIHNDYRSGQLSSLSEGRYWFHCNEEVEMAVLGLLQMQEPNFYCGRIPTLCQEWTDASMCLGIMLKNNYT